MTPTDRLIDALVLAVDGSWGPYDLRTRLAAVLRDSGDVVIVGRTAVELAVRALEVQGKLFAQNGIHPSSLIAWWNQDHIDELNAALADAGGGAETG